MLVRSGYRKTNLSVIIIRLGRYVNHHRQRSRPTHILVSHANTFSKMQYARIHPVGAFRSATPRHIHGQLDKRGRNSEIYKSFFTLHWTSSLHYEAVSRKYGRLIRQKNSIIADELGPSISSLYGKHRITKPSGPTRMIRVTQYSVLYQVNHVYIDQMDQKKIFKLRDNSSYTISNYTEFTLCHIRCKQQLGPQNIRYCRHL